MTRHETKPGPRRRLAGALTGLALLAMVAAAPAQGSFAWDIADGGAVTALDVTTAFHTDIINIGTVTDTYTITLEADMSLNWLTTMCDANLCYPPFITTRQYTVAPGDTLYVGFNITPMIDAGRGASTVTVSSANAPSQSVTAVFTVLTTGLHVLVVDADGGADTQDAVVTAVAASGRTQGLWDRAGSGKLAAAELAAFATVVWHVGDHAPGLDADDRAALAAYLAGGGRLLLSGANLAFAACDPVSAYYDPAAAAWFAATLGAGYAADSSGTPLVVGVAGDPIGDGFSFAINGGGANASPDALTALGGVACLRYAGGQVAAVRRQAGQGKTVFPGFGIGGISDPVARDGLMDAALDWLDADVSSVPASGATARVNVTASPNPFNPRTTLWLDNVASWSVPTAVDVYDLRGRHVSALFREALAPGRTALAWDGRDDAGRPLPGGTYVARVTAGGTAPVTVKLMLAK